MLSSSTDLPSTSNANANHSSATNVQCTDTKLTSSDDDAIGDFNANNAVPVPSTSTGITNTSNGQLFRRLAHQSHVDSDDDPSPENSPRSSAIPIPNNGSHHSLNVNNYSSGIDDERPNRYNNSRRRKTNISLNRQQLNNYGHYSSHSNSRLSSSCSDDDDDASSNDSLLPFSNKKTKLSENGNNNGGNADAVIATENGKATTAATSTTTGTTTTNRSSWLTPDSGISSSAVGSSSTSSGRHDGNNNGFRTNGGDSSSMKLFQQKVARVRRNYRSNFGDDSDSD